MADDKTLQVAEKVEAASTFRNATRQVAVCDILTAICNIFFGKLQQTHNHCPQHHSNIFAQAQIQKAVHDVEGKTQI